MTGLFVNALAIILGTLMGMLIKKGLSENVKIHVKHTIGLIGIAVGIFDLIKTQNALFFTISIAFGGLIGALCHIQDGIDRLANYLQRKLSKGDEDSTLGEAFSSAVLFFCVGAMVVYASIQAGLGDMEMMYIKSVLDGITALILAANLGWGVMLAAIPMCILQGAFICFASFLEPIMTVSVLNQLKGLGGAMVFCLGCNMMEVAKIKTANFLPALFGCLLMLI